MRLDVFCLTAVCLSIAMEAKAAAAVDCNLRCAASRVALAFRAAAASATVPHARSCYESVAAFDERVAKNGVVPPDPAGRMNANAACQHAEKELVAVVPHVSGAGGTAQGVPAAANPSQLAMHNLTGDTAGALSDIASLFDHRAPDGRTPFDPTAFAAYSHDADAAYAPLQQRYEFVHLTALQSEVVAETSAPATRAPQASSVPKREPAPAELLAQLEPAADAGDADARYAVALLYRDGKGGAPRDFVSAWVYCKLAADGRNAKAAAALAGIDARLSDTERAAAFALYKQKRGGV